MHLNRAPETHPPYGTKVQLCGVCVHACVFVSYRLKKKRWKKIRKKESSLAVLKIPLLNTKEGAQNDEHPACSFHFEEIAFGNIELAVMMNYTTSPLHAHASAPPKIIFTELRTHPAHTISFSLCAKGLDESFPLLKERKWDSLQTGRASEGGKVKQVREKEEGTKQRQKRRMRNKSGNDEGKECKRVRREASSTPTVVFKDGVDVWWV